MENLTREVYRIIKDLVVQFPIPSDKEKEYNKILEEDGGRYFKLLENHFLPTLGQKFVEIPIFLKKLDNLGLIKFEGQHWAKMKNLGTSLKENVPFYAIRFLKYVEPETIEDISNTPLSVSFDAQLCALKYGKKIIHKPKKKNCSGKLLKELWTNRKCLKRGGQLMSLQELCNKTGYKNEGSLHNEIAKIGKKIKKTDAPIKIEQQNGYMMVVE